MFFIIVMLFMKECGRGFYKYKSSGMPCSRSISHESKRTSSVTPARETAPSMSVGPGFGGFEEKKKKSLKMGFFKKKLKHSPSGMSLIGVFQFS